MTDPNLVPLVRSALFVPASSERFLRAAARSGADAVILDLEDGVADGSRDDARRRATDFLVDRADGHGPTVFVRINPLETGQLDADLGAAVRPGLDAVLLPKISGPDEVAELDRKLSWYEGRHDLRHGSVRIWPLLETAQAIARTDQIAAASTRVAYLGGAIAEGGDLARSLGIEPQPDGLESLYLRSRVLVEARAAGIANPITGLCTDIEDLEGLERFASAGRRLGYEGMMVIHPKHVPIVNRVFSPSADEVDDARLVVDALDAAEREGTGAARHAGRMIDAAMAKSAQIIIERDTRARALAASSGDQRR